MPGIDDKSPLLPDSNGSRPINALPTAKYQRIKSPTGRGEITQNGTFEATITMSHSSNVSKSTEVYLTETSNLETLMHLLKGMVGTGILAMPVGFKNGGLWLSFVCVFIFGGIATYCMHLLVICGNELSSRTNRPHLDYASVMEKAFETRKDKWNKYSKAARNCVNTFLLFTQFGFCCVYIVFVAQNIRQVVQHIYPHTFSDKIYILLVSICLVPYFMVKKLKTLAIFSIIANILNSAGLIIIFTNLFQGLPDVSSRPAVANLKTFPLFFGQAVFAFEGIGLVLPLHEKMIEKPAFLGWNGVINLGLTISVCLYAAMGFYGYLKFGDESAGSVTLNLPSDDWLYLSAKLMFAVSLFISCGLQFYVPVNIIWPALERKCYLKDIHLPPYTEYIFRFCLIIMICGFSALVPHLDLLISLVGAFAGSFLAFIFPPTIELVTFEVNRWTWLRNVSIIGMGFLGFVTGTYASLDDIIKTF